MSPTSANDQKLFIAALQQLPPLMRTIINNPALIDNMIAISDQYELTPAQADGMMAIERQVIIQQLPVSHIPAAIAKLGIEKAVATPLTLDFLGRIILPMAWHVGNVEPIILQLGGRTEEYLYHARRQFPEVYTPNVVMTGSTDASTRDEHPLLRNFDQKVETSRGRADLLLRLTGLAGQIDELMASEKITQADGEELLRNLDTLSYAVNTQDLNPLEIQSLKRRLRKVLSRVSRFLA